MQNPENIDSWNRAIGLAVRVHQMARHLSRTETPGLASQLRRAMSSVPTNIAEGIGQDSPAECARFLGYAISSAFEVESHLVLAIRLKQRLPCVGEILDELRQVRRMTHGLRKHYVEKAKRQKAKGRDS